MKSRYLFACFFACFALLSCDKDQQESINQGSGQETFLPMTDIDIHPLGDKLTFSYTSHYAWTLRCNVDWLKVTPTSGSSGTTTVTIEAAPNVDEKRTATVNFYNNSGSVLDSFDVTQFEAVINILIDRASRTDAEAYEYKTDGSTKVNFDWKQSRKGAGFKVESNIEWEIDIDDNERYLLKEGSNQVVSQKYGTVTDDPVQKAFNLSARYHNLNDKVFVKQVTVIPRKVNVSGNEEKLSDNVIESLTRTITISQEYLIFYLEGEELSGSGDEYVFVKPFSELGNDYLSKNEVADEEAPGEQSFYLVYEKDKVAFDESSWGALQEGAKYCFDSGDILKCHKVEEVEDVATRAEEDETERKRVCVKKHMSLIVPAPNSNQRPEENTTPSSPTSPTSKSIQLSLMVEGGNAVIKTIDYSQNLYELFMIDDNEDHYFDNLGGSDKAKYVTIKTKGPWKVEPTSTTSNWITITESTGESSKKIKIYAEKQNLNFGQNEVKLKVSSNFEKSDPGIVGDNEPEFYQKPFVFDVPYEYDNIGKDKRISRLNQEEFSAVLESCGPWTLKVETTDESEPWLDVKAVSSSNDTKYMKDNTLTASSGKWEISVKANSTNESSSERKITIKVTSDRHKDAKDAADRDKAEKNFSLIQLPYSFVVCEGGKPDKPIHGTEIPMSAYNSPAYSFDIECGAPWRIIDLPEWVKIEGPMEGDGHDFVKGLKVKVNDNTKTDWDKKREGKIVIRSYRPEFTLPDASKEDPRYEDYEFTIVQDAFVFDVDAQQDYPASALDTEDKYFSIISTEGAAWEVVADKAWVVPATPKGEGAGYKHNYTFSLLENGNLEKRQASITVRSKVVEKEERFSITQGSYRFNSESVVFPVFNELDQSSVTFNVDCLGPWEIRNCPDWIKPDKKEGKGSEGPVVVTITPDDNYEEVRDGEFIVYSKVGGVEHTKSIKVSQKDFVWNLESAPEDIELNTLESGTYEMTFKSSGKWKADVVGSDVGSHPVEWLSAKEGDGGRDNLETISFKIPENYKTSDREVAVVVTSVDDGNKKHSTSIFQKKYEFAIGESSKPDCKVLGDEFVIPIVCSGQWGVILDEEEEQYLTVNPMSGTGSTEIVVKVSPNYMTKERRGSIVIATNDASCLTKTFEVSQARYIFGLDDVPSTRLTAEPASFAFAVNCSGNWKVELDTDANKFLSIDKDSGIGNSKITVNMSLNVLPSNRTGNIVVSSTDNPDLKETIAISQAGYEWSVDSPDTKTVATLGETFTVDLTCTGNWKVNLDAKAEEFITVTPQNGSGNKTVSISSSLNRSSQTREGKVTLVSADNPEFTKTITVTQAGYEWSVDSPDTKTVATLGETFTVDLTCTGNWKVNLDAKAEEFITVTPQNGSGNKTVSISSSLNRSSQTREGKVTLISTDNPEFTKTITVTQAGYEWSVDYSSIPATVPAEGGEYQVKVSATGAWEPMITDGGDFVTIKGIDSETFSIVVSSNKRVAGSEVPTIERIAVVSVSTTDGSGKSATIDVKQIGE